MNEPRCSVCGVQHDRWKNAAHTRPASYCHSCHASWMRARRPKHSELPEMARIKANVRAYANVYQKRGKLPKQPCVTCGSQDSEKHHTDYEQPLLVTWLCRPCHLGVHS